MTKRETKAYLEAVFEAIEDAQVAREVQKALRDAAIIGVGVVQVTDDLKVKHIPTGLSARKKGGM